MLKKTGEASRARARQQNGETNKQVSRVKKIENTAKKGSQQPTPRATLPNSKSNPTCTIHTETHTMHTTHKQAARANPRFARSAMADDEEWPQELTWGANDYGRYRWCPWRGPGSDGGGGNSRSNRQNAARERRRANRLQEREDEDNEQDRFAVAQELQQERSALAQAREELQQERSALAQARQQLQQESSGLAQASQALQQERSARAQVTQAFQEERSARAQVTQQLQQERAARAEVTQELQQEHSALARVSQELQQERSAGAQAQQQLKVKEVIVNKLLEHQSKLVRDGEAGDLLSVGVLNKRPFFLVYI